MNTTEIADTLFAFITNQNAIARLIVAITISVYLLYTLVLNRQIGLLSTMVSQVSFSPILKGISVLHIIIAVVLLLYVAFLL